MTFYSLQHSSYVLILHVKSIAVDFENLPPPTMEGLDVLLAVSVLDTPILFFLLTLNCYLIYISIFKTEEDADA